MSINEQWKDIPGYEGLYQVSDHGRVKSCARVVPSALFGQQKVSEKMLKPSMDRGYARITLSYNGKTYRKTAHQFVAICFIPNPECKPHVNHIDGNHSNNHVSNLEWCTPSENEKHSYKVLGKINHQRKLHQSDIDFIKSTAIKAVRYRGGGNIKEIANKFNVDVSTIHNLINNKCYV